jgi:PAS domain-containing protein
MPISPGRENDAIPRHDDKGDDLKNVLNESRSSEPTLRQIIDKIPTLAWCNLPDGSSEFLNQRWHDYTGLSPQEAIAGDGRSRFIPRSDGNAALLAFLGVSDSGGLNMGSRWSQKHIGIARQGDEWFC